ncbi:hypothetical protein HJG60_010221 [Phyllostomus discolor]|uniref:Uncharacterized protein n=1 Tax=Phyllostomus discolor TaxID=89673 RepID=A0A834AWJ6_9CHIR|nr:hypothetical protein HJG60_010221 [Phyllostomus discolor]
MFNILRCSTCCIPSTTWITFNRFLTIFKAFVPYFHLCCTHCIVPESLLSRPNSFCRGMFKLNIKSDADSLLYLLSHFECNGHTVHILTQWCVLSPLTSTVKLSLFMHVHSVYSPWLPGYIDVAQSVFVTLINNGWTFSGQTLYV